MQKMFSVEWLNSESLIIINNKNVIKALTEII